MKKIFLPLLATLTLIIGFTACNGNKQSENTTEGDQLTALTVDECLMQVESLVGDTIDVQGFCAHLCKHAGCKAFLIGSADSLMLRCEISENLERFEEDCLNNTLKVRGIISENRIDEAYLKDWEEKVKAKEAEEHGKTKAGCASEKAANKEAPAESVEDRIANFRKQIAERQEKEGKDYLSFYYLKALSYEIVAEK